MRNLTYRLGTRERRFVSRSSIAVALSYLIGFVVLAWPWLRAMDRAIPTGPPLVSAGDGQVFTWTLAWVSHALQTDPSHLFDANLFYPAPGQLTGGEHFLSSQVVFAPLFWMSSNALWSASLLAWLSYPLAAWAMERLLRAYGCRATTAWTVGLLFALGPLRVPANLHVVQYLNVYLPLGALAVLRLHSDASVGRTLVLAVVSSLGILSSYYLALMLAVTISAWALLEARSASAGPTRFLACVAVAWGLAVLVATPMTLPYLGRPESGAPHATDFTWQSYDLYRAFRDTPGVEEVVQSIVSDSNGAVSLHTDAGQMIILITRAVGRLMPRWLGLTGVVLALGALPALLWSNSVGRRLARRGIILGGISIAMMALLVLVLSGRCPGCFALPLQFFRFPWRFVVVLGFGMALCAAATLEMIQNRLRGASGAIIVAFIAFTVLCVDGTRLLEAGLQPAEAERRPIYDRLRAEAMRDGRAPLLELPLSDPRGASFEWEAMLGSTRHWLPLISGIRSYAPPHAPLLAALIADLPNESALAQLVDMTHLRWLLLRPVHDWTDPQVRAALLERADITFIAEEQEWTLARVERSPDDRGSYAAIARGHVPVSRSAGEFPGEPHTHAADPWGGEPVSRAEEPSARFAD